MKQGPESRDEGAILLETLLVAGRRHTQRDVAPEVHDAKRNRLLATWSAPASKRTWRSVAPILAAAAALLLVVWGARSALHRQPIAKDSTVGVGQAASRAGSGSDPSPSSHVTIRVTPLNAQLSWDDAPLVGNPTSFDVKKDGLQHRLVAEAPGFAKQTELIVTDTSTVNVEMELQAAKGQSPND
jgi:hypothetical protein